MDMRFQHNELIDESTSLIVSLPKTLLETITVKSNELELMKKIVNELERKYVSSLTKQQLARNFILMIDLLCFQVFRICI